jgi:UDP-N-acetylglucosamine--N-acetylmuramyl-(pentapeptide) pyrophosphoryl-undecaprenol N-acetylglucosamine transferase
VFHQVGDKNFEDHLTRAPKNLSWYHPVPYLHDIYRAYCAADLVVSRAGAATIADFTTAGCPAILVPYKFAYADHQKANAECVAKNGAAIIINENDLTAKGLAGLIMELKSNADRLQKMASASKDFAGPDAAEDIVKIANKLAGAGQEA